MGVEKATLNQPSDWRDDSSTNEQPEGEGPRDVFGNEEGHDIKYKTLSWPIVALLMITETVSNGMLSLPFVVAAVGIVPAVVVITFLGVFATYTAWLLVQFKLHHPEVHNMGDAGFILFGPIGREVLSFGTIAFAVFGTGSQLLTGQLALATLSDSRLCLLLYTGIFAAATLVCSFPRTYDRLGWASGLASICILVAGIIGMVGAGVNPAKHTTITVARSTSFYNAFVAVTNPVFAYAGHFMFFSLISEMKHPQHAMRSAYVLQGFSTCLYVIFAVISYVYLGNSVASPSLLSLPTKWAKAAFGVVLPNFLIAGALYSHLAAKLVFVRIFRKARHLHDHTVAGWGVWTVLILLMNGAAFVLAVGIPVFNYVVGLTASLFAAWYTYGLAGGFWLHDSWYGENKNPAYETGLRAWKRYWFQATLALATVCAGAFICVAGVYVSIRGIVDAYNTGAIMKPFAC